MSSDADPAAGHVRPRLWPAVLIVLTQAAVWLETYLFSSNNIHGLIGFLAVPVLAGLLLLLWWLLFSRIPWRQRFAGLAFFIAALAAPCLVQGKHFELILMAALPATGSAAVAILFATARQSWRFRRWAAVAGMAACALLFAGLRGESIGGDMLPALSWRWTPTSEAVLLAADEERGADPDGTATLPSEPGPGDWPEFRGPARDGRVPGVTFPTDWATNPPRELWRRPRGTGLVVFLGGGRLRLHPGTGRR